MRRMSVVAAAFLASALSVGAAPSRDDVSSPREFSGSAPRGGITQPSNDAEALMMQGEALRREGKSEQARDIFMEHLRRFGPSAPVFANIAFVEWRLGRADIAADFAQRAIDTDSNYPYGHYYLGLARYERGEDASALAAFDAALAIYPEDGDALIDRGNAKFRLNEYDAAYADYVEAERLYPTWVIPPTNKAFVHLRKENWAAAEEQARKAIALDPAFADASRNLAYALQEQDRPLEALRAFDEALAKGAAPGDVLRDKALALEKLNSLDEALSTANAALKINANFVDMATLKARVANAKGRNGELKAFVKDALARHLISPNDYTTYAFDLKEMNQLQLAHDVLRVAVKKYPDSRDVQLEYGWAAYDVGKKDVALQAFVRCTELQPQRGANWADRATLESELGQHDLAMKHFGQALALEPDNALIHYNLGWAHLRKKDYPATIKAFQQALDIDPRNVSINIDLGYVADVIGDDAMAEKHARAALAIEPNQLVALTNLSDVLARTGKLVEARALAQKARALDPQNSDHIIAVAFTLIQTGEIEQAAAQMKEARALLAKKRTPMYYYVLGLLREKQNRLADARENYELVLTSDPNDWYQKHAEIGLQRLK